MISDFGYHPANLSVVVGTTVTFINHDQTAHTATSVTSPPKFDTGTLAPGQSKTITLNSPGSYPYFCQFHAFMHGTMTVVK